MSSEAPNSSDGLALPWQRVRLAIVVVDMVESVRWMERHESAVIAYWRRFVQVVRTELLPAHGGRMIKSLGDGMLLAFPTPRGAVAAAHAVQRWTLAAEPIDDQARIQVRVGIHLTEVVEDAIDVYGSGVNLAARLAAAADPGETWISSEIRDELTPGVDCELEDLGDVYLKHLSLPQRAFKASAPGTGPPRVDPGHASDDLRPAIAVIPFRCRDQTDQRNILGDLVADEVTIRLARVPDWRVISKLSSAAFTGRESNLEVMSTALHADFICTGAYRLGDRRLSLQVQLVHAPSAEVLWADSKHSPLDAVLAGEDGLFAEVCDGIASAVFGHGLRSIGSVPLPQIRSHELLLGAVALMHRAQRREFGRALEIIDHLEQRHPRSAQPSAWRAKWHVLRVVQGWSEDPMQDGNLALQAGRRAAHADSHSSLALAMQGLVHAYLRQDFEAAAECYDDALVQNPNESLARLLRGTMHAFLAQGDVAYRETQAALQLSPLDPLRYFYLSLAASAAVADRRYDEAIELARASLRINRVHLSTYRALAMAQSLAGRMTEAAQTTKMLLQLEPGYTTSRFLERFPGRDRAPDFTHLLADALRQAGLPP